MLNHDVTTIATFDAVFDHVPGIKRLALTQPVGQGRVAGKTSSRRAAPLFVGIEWPVSVILLQVNGVVGLYPLSA